MEIKLWGNQGWSCPQCGKVFGPEVQECFYCNATTVTTSGTEEPYEFRDLRTPPSKEPA